MNLRRWNFSTIILFILIAAYVFPIWYFNFFPAFDGSSHITNAINLKNLLTGDCPETAKLFHITPSLVPNYIGHIFIILLSEIFTPQIIDKILLTLITIGIPLAVYNLIRKINPRATFLVIPSTLFIHTWMFFGGNYNFLISIILFIFFISWWRSNYTKFRFKHAILLLIIYPVLYFSHLFGFAAFICSAAIIAMFDLIRIGRMHLKKVIKAAIFNLAAAAPYFVFLGQYMSMPKMPFEGQMADMEKLIHIIFPTSLYNFSPLEGPLVTITAGLIWLLFALVLYTRTFHQSSKQTKHKNADYTFYLALFFMLVIFFVPSSYAGGWIIEQRLQLIAWLFLIMWLSTVPYSRLARNILIAVTLCLSVYALSVKYIYIAKYDKILTQFSVAESYIPDNSTIFAVDISPLVQDYNTGETNFRSLMPNITGYITANKCIYEISNYHSAEKNTFPVTYNNKLNPYFSLGEFREKNSKMHLPPIISFDKYYKKTGTLPDYVIIRGDEEFLPAHSEQAKKESAENYKQLMQQTNKYYELEHELPLVHVYKLKKTQLRNNTIFYNNI